MTDHAWGGVFGRERDSGPSSSRTTRRGVRKPQFDLLEARQLLVASLAPIANLAVPEFLGFQVPLNGAGSPAPQSFSVRSDNPNVKAAVAQGRFLTLNVTHAASPGVANDISFEGSVTFQLFQDLTPLTTERIESLVASGFYTGKNFHRIARGFPSSDDFIVQGGSVNGNGTGDVGRPGFPFADEFNQQLAFTGAGQLAMANSGDDTNQSQFFVTTGSPRALDFQHTIFGQVVSGQEVIAQMTRVAIGPGDTPRSPILISSASLSDVNPNGVIHIDTTTAVAGDAANIVVTAVDPSTNTTAAQSFRVDVAADASNNERPFLQPVEDQAVGLNQVATFQLRGIDSDPDDVLTYIVQGGTTTSTTGGNPTTVFSPVANATATVDSATGIVRVTPRAGFSGRISLIVGVRDDVNRGGGAVDAPANFDTQRLTLTVNADATALNLRPIALPIRATAGTGTPTPIQLAGDDANPGTGQGLTFSIVSQPSHGTIAEFDPATGTLLYTPAPGFNGPDSFLYTVRDTGAPFPNFDSLPSAVSLTVAPPLTGTVRLIENVLVVTPQPRTDGGTNTILVTQFADPAADGLDRVRVSINGTIDETQPLERDLLRIVVFGSKANDVITVDPSVTVPATLDGGHGGRNRLKAGSAPTTLHGWFGANVLAGGPEMDRLIGRAGRVRFVASPGGDIAFLGNPSRKSNGEPNPPEGTFYRFVRGQLVALPSRESDGEDEGHSRPHPRPRMTRPMTSPRTGRNRNQ